VPASVRVLTVNRVDVSLGVVFLLASVFYVWTAGTTLPLALSGGQADAYNQLAHAFLHFRLSVGHPPAGLLNLPEPYNPAENAPFQGVIGPLQLGIHDFALYHGNLFLTWGPAPAIVLLVPLHLLGFDPTSSFTVCFFAIVGLGFALATLRVVLQQIGDVPVWMCVLAALTLALSSAVPFILRRPAVYEESICGGYCFAMAGIWLAISTLANRRASLSRLALMSLCIGLAVGSRPNLIFIAVVLVLVYVSLREVRPRRGPLMALVLPIGVCILLLLAYNQARFGDPLDNGAKYQLSGGVDQHTAHFDDLSYVPPGLWFYWVSPLRGETLFPFIFLTPPPLTYPGSLPGLYPKQLESTGGLLPMAPILVFLAALPWIWRRRSNLLGPLALPLLMLAAAGVACVLFLSFVFFSTTERYEVDFATLFLLGALASWLAISASTRGWRRRLARVGGGLLAIWGCVAGLAISFTGYYNLLASTHPGTWQTLEDVSSPISTAIVTVEGHPVLAETSEPNGSLLAVGQQDRLIIVSPDARTTALLATWAQVERNGDALERAAYPSSILVRGPGHAHSIYRISPGSRASTIPVRLNTGLNRLALIPLASEIPGSSTRIPASQQLLLVESLSLASNQ
jgi:hypothetical protein